MGPEHAYRQLDGSRRPLPQGQAGGWTGRSLFRPAQIAACSSVVSPMISSVSLVFWASNVRCCSASVRSPRTSSVWRASNSRSRWVSASWCSRITALRSLSRSAWRVCASRISDDEYGLPDDEAGRTEEAREALGDHPEAVVVECPVMDETARRPARHCALSEPSNRIPTYPAMERRLWLKIAPTTSTLRARPTQTIRSARGVAADDY